MSNQHSIKHSLQKDSTSSSLQNIVVDLDEQHEESISAGFTILVPLFLYSGSSKTNG